MLLGWILLALAVILTLSLFVNFTRLMIEQHRLVARPARKREDRLTLRRLGRVVVEPILGR